MKIVRSDVPEVWAKQSQPTSRNATGSLYHEGATIYSYGKHFPIASFINVPGGRAVLFTTRDSSVTTQRHKSKVRSAHARHCLAPHIPLFHVPDPTALPSQDDVSDYIGRILELRLRAQRSIRYKAMLTHQADELCEELHKFCALFGLAMPADCTALQPTARPV